MALHLYDHRCLETRERLNDIVVEHFHPAVHQRWTQRILLHHRVYPDAQGAGLPRGRAAASQLHLLSHWCVYLQGVPLPEVKRREGIHIL